MPLIFVKEPILSKKISAGICICAMCSRPVAKHRKICHTHINDQYKEKNPIRYAYKVLKNNAKRRKVGFSITIDEFIKFCDENNYMELKGVSASSYTIDRKKSEQGYTYDNMQILFNSQNVKKMWIEMRIRLGRYPTEEELLEIQSPILSSKHTTSSTEEDDSCPF